MNATMIARFATAVAAAAMIALGAQAAHATTHAASHTADLSAVAVATTTPPATVDPGSNPWE
jgi:hypothetical protein